MGHRKPEISLVSMEVIRRGKRKEIEKVDCAARPVSKFSKARNNGKHRIDLAAYSTVVGHSRDRGELQDSRFNGA